MTLHASPLTHRSKDFLRYALRRMDAAGHEYIGSASVKPRGGLRGTYAGPMVSASVSAALTFSETRAGSTPFGMYPNLHWTRTEVRSAALTSLLKAFFCIFHSKARTRHISSSIWVLRISGDPRPRGAASKTGGEGGAKA